jgi:hypothetical protein
MKIEIGSEDTNGLFQSQLSADISQLGSEEKAMILRLVQAILSVLHGTPSPYSYSKQEASGQMIYDRSFDIPY